MKEETLMRALDISAQIEKRKQSLDKLYHVDKGYGPTLFVDFKMDKAEDEEDIAFIHGIIESMQLHQEKRILELEEEFKKL